MPLVYQGLIQHIAKSMDHKMVQVTSQPDPTQQNKHICYYRNTYKIRFLDARINIYIFFVVGSMSMYIMLYIKVPMHSIIRPSWLSYSTRTILARNQKYQTQHLISLLVAFFSWSTQPHCCAYISP